MSAVAAWIREHRNPVALGLSLLFLTVIGLDLYVFRHGSSKPALIASTAAVGLVGIAWAFSIPDDLSRRWVIGGAVVAGLLTNAYLTALVAESVTTTSKQVQSLARHQHVLGMLAFLALYFTVTGATIRLRRHEAVGRTSLALAVVGLVVLGARLYVGGASLGFLALAAGGLLALMWLGLGFGGPAGVHVLVGTDDPTMTPRLFVSWAVGGLLAVAGFVWVGSETHAWKVLLVVSLVLGLLALSFASDRPFDVVLIAMVVAFLGTTRPDVPAPTQTPPAKTDTVLLSLGDSYMSGEGARSFYDGTDQGGADECRRAPTAWAVQAVHDKHLFQQLDFLACSGGQTYNISGTDPAHDVQRGEPGTQLTTYASLQTSLDVDHPDPDLVVVSIGGNDANFATVGATCFAPGDCSAIAPLFEGALTQVEARLEETYAAIHAQVPTSPILVIPYPNPIYSKNGVVPTACKDQHLLSQPERAFVNTFVQQLDGVIDQAVAASSKTMSIRVLDAMQSAFVGTGQQICDPSPVTRTCHGLTTHTAVNVLLPYSVKGNFNRRLNPKNWIHSSLHPNECGHDAMLAVFQKWMSNGATGSPIAAPPLPPKSCTLAGAADISNDCDDQANAFVAEQARKRAEPVAPGVVLLFAGEALLALCALALLRVGVQAPKKALVAKLKL